MLGPLFGERKKRDRRKERMVGKIYGQSGKVVARKRADYGDPKGTLSYVENGSGANVERPGTWSRSVHRDRCRCRRPDQ